MEIFSALLALCAGNSPVTGEFPAQRTVTRSFDVFFDLRLNKRLNKQWWGWWFETPLRSLWRHRNEKLCQWTHSRNDSKECAPCSNTLLTVNTSICIKAVLMWMNCCLKLLITALLNWISQMFALEGLIGNKSALVVLAQHILFEKSVCNLIQWFCPNK